MPRRWKILRQSAANEDYGDSVGGPAKQSAWSDHGSHAAPEHKRSAKRNPGQQSRAVTDGALRSVARTVRVVPTIRTGGASANCCADTDADCGGPYTIPVTVAIPVTAAIACAAAIPCAAAIACAAAIPCAAAAVRTAAAAATAAAVGTAAATATAAGTASDICDVIVKRPYARSAEHL